MRLALLLLLGVAARAEAQFEYLHILKDEANQLADPDMGVGFYFEGVRNLFVTPQEGLLFKGTSTLSAVVQKHGSGSAEAAECAEIWSAPWGVMGTKTVVEFCFGVENNIYLQACELVAEGNTAFLAVDYETAEEKYLDALAFFGFINYVLFEAEYFVGPDGQARYLDTHIDYLHERYDALLE